MVFHCHAIKKNRSICIKPRIWEMKRGEYTKILAAKIQAGTFFHMRHIFAEMIYRYSDYLWSFAWIHSVSIRRVPTLMGRNQQKHLSLSFTTKV